MLKNDVITYEETIQRILTLGNASKRNFKLDLKGNITEGSHNEEEIVIGIRNLCDAGFINNPTMSKYSKIEENVPLFNFVTVIKTVMHELSHEKQMDYDFKAEATDRNIFMAMDCISNKCCYSYYHYSDNYKLMAHEIDAEKNALIKTYHYLHDECEMNYDDAERLVVELVNNKFKTYHDSKTNIDYTTSYFISPKESYKTLEEILTDFDKAFELAKIRHRTLTKDMIFDPKVNIFKDGIKTFFQDTFNRVKNNFTYTSDFQAFYQQDEEAMRMLMSEPTGYQQTKMITCMALKYRPEYVELYPVLKGIELNENDLFGRALCITAKIKHNKDIIKTKYESEIREQDDNFER